MSKFWIGVASRDHVRRGVEGGFCQLGHGKAPPLKRLGAGDGIIYYSPKAALQDSAALQAFTALGQIKPGEPYQADMGGGFLPWRRDVAWTDAADAEIRPLLERLELTRGQASWGGVFRFGLVGISKVDFTAIAEAMGVAPSWLAE